ncbi:PLP-dependent transferase [Sphingomonas sp. CA1-15]|uniref:PLP-dependent transferase n=1 Tax=Sphingomonas immobilis TaxID=3063997 RepID=A0ABT9A490_9SPHN|nr:PLP-dependent transferase [Sphingomonas sp. CA1-15]MDO7844159.1 PLP-dependent transferase [Sphingomonas sp. CA1-15]
MTEPKDQAPRAQTIAAAHGVASDVAFGAVAPPLYLSSTYEFSGYDQPRSYDYGRAGNPTRDLLGQALAKLEGGAGAVITASGMAALDLLVGRMGPGDLILAPHDCYGGTMRLLMARAKPPARRAASCSNAITWVPWCRLRAASRRISRDARRPCTI